MTTYLPDPEIFAFLMLAFGGPMLGILRWLNWTRLGLCAATTFGVVAGVLFASEQPLMIWGAPLGLSAAYLTVAIVARCRELLLSFFASRRAVGLSLIAAGPILAGAWLYGFVQTTAPMINDFELTPAAVASGEPIVLSEPAFTDLGRPIPLATRPPDQSAAELKESERQLTRGYHQALIRTAAVNPATNCHGWVFTGGRYSIRSEDVEAILTDNGYRPVTAARAGDLVLYRDSRNLVSHTGLIRLVMPGIMLVESKWGHLGVYLHAVDSQPYGQNWAVLRSTRTDHILHGSSTYIDAAASGR